MLHIIGILLKCIGILLAVILGIIVLVLVTVLFVPIRFEVKASFPGKPEDITASAKITWLLHLIRADVDWKEKALHWKVRAAWKKIDGEPKEESDEKAVKEESSKEKPEKKELAKKESAKQEAVQNTVKEENRKSDSVKKETKQSPTPDKVTTEETAQEGFFEKIKSKIQAIIERIKCTFQKICDKIKEGLDLKEQIVDFLTDKIHKNAFMRLKKELVWLKRFFKFEKGNINLRFGFDDPATTGQALAGLSVLYALLEGNVCVEPDFEEKCLEGDVFLKGRVRLIYIAMMALKIIIDKNVRQTYKDIMAFIKSKK